MSATLRLTRRGHGIELRRGQFEIVVDGKSDLTHARIAMFVPSGRYLACGGSRRK